MLIKSTLFDIESVLFHKDCYYYYFLDHLLYISFIILFNFLFIFEYSSGGLRDLGELPVSRVYPHSSHSYRVPAMCPISCQVPWSVEEASMAGPSLSQVILQQRGAARTQATLTAQQVVVEVSKRLWSPHQVCEWEKHYTEGIGGSGRAKMKDSNLLGEKGHAGWAALALGYRDLTSLNLKV